MRKKIARILEVLEYLWDEQADAYYNLVDRCEELIKSIEELTDRIEELEHICSERYE